MYSREDGMLLRDRVAIITGGGRGIGRSIALRFAQEGAAVVVAARSEVEIRGVAAEIENGGGRASAVSADVGIESGCEQIVQAACDKFGAIDILVNAAGIYGPVKPVEQISASEWDAVMAANLRGPFLLSRLVLPDMYKRGREGPIFIEQPVRLA